MPVARDPVTAYVALGANLGDPVAAVRRAVTALTDLPDTRVAAVSSLYRSPPFQADGPDFINAVVGILTRLSAPDLLELLQKIEHMAGRQRPYPNAPRTLDLDLLRYGEGRIESPRLTLPHPRMQERAFVLRPLHEIAPDQVTRAALDAVAHQPIKRLTPTCQGP